MALIALSAYLPMPTGTQSFTLKDDRVYYSCQGAQSFGFFTQAISIGRSYRNELPASYIGRAWIELILYESTDLAGTAYSTLFPAQTPMPTNNGEAGTFNPAIVTSRAPIALMMDLVAAKDDRWTGTPPHDDPAMTSFMVFMSGADGTGSAVAACVASKFDQFSPLPPSRF